MIEYHAKVMKDRKCVTIEYVDKLIFQENGKFIPLISKLK